jgi:hypothetical protein
MSILELCTCAVHIKATLKTKKTYITCLYHDNRTPFLDANAPVLSLPPLPVLNRLLVVLLAVLTLELENDDDFVLPCDEGNRITFDGIFAVTLRIYASI